MSSLRFGGGADGGDLGADGDLAGIPGLEPGLKDAFDEAEAGLHGHPALRFLDLLHFAGDQVVDADEIGHEGVLRSLVKIAGGAELLELPVIEDGDAVREGQGLFLIVGHIDGGDGQILLELSDFGAYLLADLGVQVGEGLVEQKHVRIENQGARQGHTLLLTARELTGIPFFEARQIDQRQRVVHLLGNFPMGCFLDLEAVGHIVEDGHVRPEGIVLKDHADVPFIGGHRRYFPVSEVDLPVIGFVKAADETEDRRLAATRRPQQRKEFAVLDIEGDMTHGLQGAESFHHVFELDIHSLIRYRSKSPSPPLPPGVGGRG